MKPLSEHGQFIVTFDPLDGSSIIGTNFTVGTIVGVWPRDDEYSICPNSENYCTKREIIWYLRSAAFMGLGLLCYFMRMKK